MLNISIVVATCILNLILGLLVLARYPKQRTGISFFSISIFVSLWAVSNYITGSTQVSLSYNELFNKLSFIFALFAMVSAVWFTTAFSIVMYKSKRLVIGLLAAAAIVAVLSGTASVAGKVSRGPKGLDFSIGPLLPFYAVAVVISLTLVAANLYRVIKVSKGREKQQAIYILVGFSVPVVFGLFTNAIIPSITSNWSSASFGPVFTFILVGIISYSIVRHRLFDLRFAVARSLAYLSSLGAVVFLYAIGAFGLLNLVFNTKIGVSDELWLAVFSAGTALVFSPVKRFFDRITNKLFYRDAYDAQVFIGQLNKVLVSSTDVDKLLQNSAEVISQNLKAEYCVFGLKETKFNSPRIIGTTNKVFAIKDISTARRVTPHFSNIVTVTDDMPAELNGLKFILVRNNISVLIRLTPDPSDGGEGLGYILLGGKRSGNPYSRKDVQVLDIISRELVIAVQNALHFEEIQQFNLTLQQKVDDATHKLRQTNDKLRTLDQTKDEFISMASHQLRTPLTSVKGYVSMVLDGDVGEITPMQRKLLNQSFVSSQRMVYLIADLLNISRLRTGKFIIEPIPTNLAKVTQGEVEQLIETAKGRGLELSYRKPDQFPEYMLDETKLRQVIMNFADNAIYYTPSGGHIVVELKDKPQSVELTVSDDGMGVPKSEQHHLFTKFYRAPNAKRARPDGTGLGLFMAKKVIVAQGGSLIFNSAEGKGSTFGFSFAKKNLVLAPDKHKTFSHKK